MRKLNTLNEEINRMKSLFGESRLYGNLVEQEDDVCEWFKPKQNKAIGILEKLISTSNVGKINPFSSEEKKKKIEELLKVLKESKKSIEEISCEDGIEVICNQENREKIDGGIEIIEEKKDGDDAKMVKNELEELLTLLNEIKQKCVEYDSTKKNSEGGDNKQEEPTTKEVSNDEEEGGEGGDVTQEEPKEEKTTTKVIPTELMDCDEVEMGDDWDDEGYTGLFKFCENGKATSVTERKDGKDHGLYRSWDTNGNLEIVKEVIINKKNPQPKKLVTMKKKVVKEVTLHKKNQKRKKLQPK